MENRVTYLRLSLTDRCNLNCIYCTPLQRGQFLSRNEVLSYEEITKVVALFVKAGVRKVRLTGGEPLIKRNITGLIRMLRGIDGLEEISMTTNGIFLKGIAGRLKQSGLDRVNISIDTLKKEKFKAITGFDGLDDVWQGINESLEAGLLPVKLNVILMRGINDDEAVDFAQLTLDYSLIVRFIELFSANKRSTELSHSFLKSDEVKKNITACLGVLSETSEIKGNGPARYYKLDNSKGAIGFISSSSGNFCDGCNRIRIDCAGGIRPCLFSGPTHDIRPLLRSAQSEEAILEYIKNIFEIKSNYRKNKVPDRRIEMSGIGG